MANSVQTVLLVDDDPDILEILSYHLKSENYRVLTAKNGRKAVEIAGVEVPDLIILDVMMPEMDGVETCVELRALPQLKDVVIAFLTARNEDYSQIAGLEAGADDYIAKPIKPRVFISRVKALLRRREKEVQGSTSEETPGLVIDRERYLVSQNGADISLPKKEFELIALLHSRPGKVFTREEILESIWGQDVVVGDRTIDVHIRKLREKLGSDLIRTIKGVGYTLDLPE